MIILNRTIQTPIEKSEIKTNIQHTSFLPLQVLVSQLCCLKSCPISTIYYRDWTIGTICWHSSIGTKTKSITTNTISHTELQVWQIQSILQTIHKTLLCNIPRSRYRRESSPTMILTKHRRAITTKSCLQHITTVIWIRNTTIERDVADFLLSTTFHRCHTINLTRIT